eukprot:gene14904-20045_t
MSWLRKFKPEFKTLIDETARNCFGNLPIVPYRTGNKILRQKLMGPLVMKHYLPQGIDRAARKIAPDYKSPLEQRRFDKADRLKRRGKGPPKKGQGKRAMRKK